MLRAPPREKTLQGADLPRLFRRQEAARDEDEIQGARLRVAFLLLLVDSCGVLCGLLESCEGPRSLVGSCAVSWGLMESSGVFWGLVSWRGPQEW